MDPLHGRSSRHDLVAQGVSPAALRSRRFRRVAHGWYAPAGEDPTTGYTRILDAAALIPPGGTLGGWAAAHLLGASELDGRCSVTRRLLPIPIFVPPKSGMRPHAGVIVRRSQVRDDERCEVDGIPVTAPTRTGSDLARTPGLEQAVATVDTLLRAGVVQHDELMAYVAKLARGRGVVQARQVTELMENRARSPQESRLRLLWMREAELPRPCVNCAVFALDGWFLGIPDLLDEETGLIAEYDGAGHREAQQHAYDNAREELLERHGLVVVRASAVDLGLGRKAFVHRLRAAYDRAARSAAEEPLWTLHPETPWGFHQPQSGALQVKIK
jgi:hypothetical protein